MSYCVGSTPGGILVLLVSDLREFFRNLQCWLNLIEVYSHNLGIRETSKSCYLTPSVIIQRVNKLFCDIDRPDTRPRTKIHNSGRLPSDGSLEWLIISGEKKYFMEYIQSIQLFLGDICQEMYATIGGINHLLNQ
jgi:hypothetical protein